MRKTAYTYSTTTRDKRTIYVIRLEWLQIKPYRAITKHVRCKDLTGALRVLQSLKMRSYEVIFLEHFN